jgi:hypothetical protein
LKIFEVRLSDFDLSHRTSPEIAALKPSLELLADSEEEAKKQAFVFFQNLVHYSPKPSFQEVLDSIFNTNKIIIKIPLGE